MKLFFFIVVIGSLFSTICAHSNQTIRAYKKGETALIGHHDEKSSETITINIEDNEIQSFLILGSLLATGYMLRYDFEHIMNNNLKQQALLKGLLAYVSGKQIYHYYSDNILAQEAGNLLSHYGQTIIALLLIYG